MRYQPDGDLTQPGLLFEVREFAPNNNGAYKRVYGIVDAGWTALPTSTCVGAAQVKNAAGTTKVFAGTPTKVYQASGVSGGWTDRSGGTSFSATSWDFAQFGDFTVGANGSSLIHSCTSSSMAAITSSPTGAAILCVHANALVALNSTANPAGWYRSVSGDHTNFTAAANNDADAGTLYGGVGGPITAGCTWGNLIIAWKSRAMYVGVYVGNSDPDSDVIRWQLVSDNIGCVAKDAWVITDVGVVFVGERGIYLYNGNAPTPIDADIRKNFITASAANRSRIFCTHDEANNHVYVWYADSGQSATYCSSAYIWNYRTQTWGKLLQLNNNTGSVYGNARAPLKYASYRGLQGAFSTLPTNTDEVANLFFDDSAFRVLNLAATTYDVSGNGYLRTGLVTPRIDKDVMLKRVHLASDGYSGISTTPTLTAIAYQPGRLLQNSQSASVLTSGGYWDIPDNPRGRQFELQATFPAGAGQISVSKLVCEFQDVVVDKSSLLI